MKVKGSYPAGEIAAEQADQFGDGKVEERGLAVRLQLRRQPPAEIYLDLRPAEGPEVIDSRSAAIAVAEQAAIFLEFIGIGQRQEHFVGQPQRQARRRLGLLGQARREKRFSPRPATRSEQ